MSKSTEIIPLVMAFTPNYFIPAAVCLKSIMDHASDVKHLHIICLLTEPMSFQMQQQLRELGNGKTQYSFIDLRGKLSDVNVPEKYTIASCYRLLLPDLLPAYEKVIYIDCDMVVRQDLTSLFRNTDMGDHYLAGVIEAILDFQKARTVAAGCDPRRYINSGLLIMNLKQLRKDGIVPQFIKALKAENLEFPDQDVLNKVCKDRILGIPPVFNAIRTFFLPQYKGTFLEFYNEEMWNEVQTQGNVHYTGSKPWDTFTVNFNLWWDYYDRLPASVRNVQQLNKNRHRLSQIYRTATGRFLVDGAQYCYRRLKYGRQI